MEKELPLETIYSGEINSLIRKLQSIEKWDDESALKKEAEELLKELNDELVNPSRHNFPELREKVYIFLAKVNSPYKDLKRAA